MPLTPSYREIPITLDKAEKFLDKHNELSKAITKKSKTGIDKPEGVFEFIDNEYNSFIFTKDSMLKLFDKGAEYIIVALGAHDKHEVTANGRSFDKGSFTVMTLGYKEDPNDPKKLIPINKTQPGYEYPPKYIVNDLDEITDVVSVQKNSHKNQNNIITKKNDSMILTIH